jgi:hypothetical protein
MPTIRVRDVPEAVYETLRRRARRDGQAIQAYMRERVVELAETPSSAETLELIERALARWGGANTSGQQIADDVAADRR